MRKLGIVVLLLLSTSVLLSSGYRAQVSTVTGGTVTNPEEALLGYEVHGVTVMAGQQSEGEPVDVYNRLPVAATILSLTCPDATDISIETWSPETVPGDGEEPITAVYYCDQSMPAGEYMIAHRLLADLGNASVCLAFEVPVTVIAESEDYGCSVGFWKTEPHSNEWPPGYSPNDSFNETFGIDIFDPDMSLMDALWLEGGHEDALARQAVAALLNAAHPDVDFGLTEDAVMEAVCEACETGDYEEVKDELEGYNTAVGGCPL